MDKYQKLLLTRGKISLSINQIDNQEIAIKEDSITLVQNNDITITDYVFYFENDAVVSAVAMQGADAISLNKDGNRFFIKIDFENPFDNLQISFKNNIADDIRMPFVFVCANKDQYYKRIEEEQRIAYQKTANINCVAGADLINVYFQPCCEEYDHSEVALYRGFFLGIFPVEKNYFYKSITGLAYGTYNVKIKQFKQDGSVILESDLVAVHINPPVKDNGSFAPPSGILKNRYC